MSEVIICPKCNKAGVIPMWDPVHNITYKACRFCGKALEVTSNGNNWKRADLLRTLCDELDELLELEEINYGIRDKISAIISCIIADMEDR